MNRTKAESTVRRVVDLVVEGNYRGLEALTYGQRLPAEELKAAVASVEDVLVPLTNSDLSEVEFDEVSGSLPQKWWAAVDLRSSEGVSDLTLEIVLTDNEADDFYSVEVEDLRVL